MRAQYIFLSKHLGLRLESILAVDYSSYMHLVRTGPNAILDWNVSGGWRDDVAPGSCRKPAVGTAEETRAFGRFDDKKTCVAWCRGHYFVAHFGRRLCRLRMVDVFGTHTQEVVNDWVKTKLFWLDSWTF